MHAAHLMTLTVMAPRLPASNAFLRLHSSYRMQPMAQMSVLPSYERPCRQQMLLCGAQSLRPNKPCTLDTPCALQSQGPTTAFVPN